MQKDRLTNEALKKHFRNNFELANYVINVARYFIKSGHEMPLDDLLREIEKHPNRYNVEELEAMERADSKEGS